MSTTPAAVSVPVYDIDPVHSSAQFKVRHLMISNVKGEFTKISGKIALDENNPGASSVDVTIDADSISTREPQRDAHLKSADFFDVAQFPTLTFKSTNVARHGDGYAVTGNLTIHGVTNEVKLNVEEVMPDQKDPWGLLRRGATATTKINRKEFGLGWNQVLETGGIAVGEEVHITIDVEFVRKTS